MIGCRRFSWCPKASNILEHAPKAWLLPYAEASEHFARPPVSYAYVGVPAIAR